MRMKLDAERKRKKDIADHINEEGKRRKVARVAANEAMAAEAVNQAGAMAANLVPQLISPVVNNRGPALVSPEKDKASDSNHVDNFLGDDDFLPLEFILLFSCFLNSERSTCVVVSILLKFDMELLTFKSRAFFFLIPLLLIRISRVLSSERESHRIDQINIKKKCFRSLSKEF